MTVKNRELHLQIGGGRDGLVLQGRKRSGPAIIWRLDTPVDRHCAFRRPADPHGVAEFGGSDRYAIRRAGDDAPAD